MEFFIYTAFWGECKYCLRSKKFSACWHLSALQHFVSTPATCEHCWQLSALKPFVSTLSVLMTFVSTLSALLAPQDPLPVASIPHLQLTTTLSWYIGTLVSPRPWPGGRHCPFPEFIVSQQSWLLLPLLLQYLQNNTRALGHALAKCPSFAHRWQALRVSKPPIWVIMRLVTSALAAVGTPSLAPTSLEKLGGSAKKFRSRPWASCPNQCRML